MISYELRVAHTSSLQYRAHSMLVNWDGAVDLTTGLIGNLYTPGEGESVVLLVHPLIELQQIEDTHNIKQIKTQLDFLILQDMASKKQA